VAKVNLAKMASSGLRFEDRLEGAANFIPWMERITLVLMGNGLWDFAEKEIQVPSDPTQATAHNLEDVKARGIILDVAKNHIIPHITRKNTTHKMWTTFVMIPSQFFFCLESLTNH
jgi:hypothetical protein